MLDEMHDIEAAMRRGYQEPMGNWYRARMHELNDGLLSLHCPRLE
jgi:hypothetical protein